jgi:hypothetical protein
MGVKLGLSAEVTTYIVFQKRVLRIILEPKGNKSQEDREKFMVKNLSHFYFSSVEEGEMIGAFSTIGGDGKYITNV